ncbi:MAG TPA: hypothetical protein VN841_02550 [Bryobacteraceae bacterium]|nr:hypothetical protein [Bryobacteraceae bacterium]
MSSSPAVLLPNKPQYGSQDVLAPNVGWWNNRAECLAATGKQAPPFTAGQPVKRWLVTGIDPGGFYSFSYLGLDAAGNPALLSMTLLASTALALNMPGMVAFQTYASWLAGRAPSKGTVEYRFFGQDLVNPMDVAALFTPDEAGALAAELSAQLLVTFTAVVLTAPDGNATAVYNYDPSDPRRIYDLKASIGTGLDQMFSMGGATGLFALRSSVGVGAPGNWSWTMIPDPSDPSGEKQAPNYAAGPRWAAAVPADGSTEAREIPIPVRPLVTPPEKLVALFGNVVAVERTDLMTPASLGGGLTDAQAAMLSDVDAKVTALWKTLPPSA